MAELLEDEPRGDDPPPDAGGAGGSGIPADADVRAFDPTALDGPVWTAMGREEALAALAATDGGLTAAEAARRRGLVGPNLLPRPERASVLRLFLRQFKDPLVYLLLAAALVSLAIGELADAGFIFAVLLLNAVIGTTQEWKAAASAAALDALVSATAMVRRDGRPVEVDATKLVPGDVVLLASGASVPADLRLLTGRELTIDESLLTGESTPVAKDPAARPAADAPLAERRNMLHAGATLLTGRAEGVVTATAGATEIGRIAEALALGDPVPPPLLRRLATFSKVVGVVTVGVIAVLAVTQLLQGAPLATVFLVAVALAVAAIPEGLPVAITVALAIASNRMARRNVIVRAPPAVEGLGACTLIASDKTGTLTCNELTVKRVCLLGAGPQTVPTVPTVPTAERETPEAAAAPGAPEPKDVEISGEGFEPHGEARLFGGPLDAATADALERLAESGALCNEASVRFAGPEPERLGDTVDIAFLVMAAKLGLDPDEVRRANRTVGQIPYEPQRRYAATFTAGGSGTPGHAMAHVKGAAEVVLPMCSGAEASGGTDPDRVLAEADRLAAAGYRVLAVARGTVAPDAVEAAPETLQGLELLGLVGLIDPVRPEVPDAVARCRDAGIAVRMVTGDHPLTALAISRELGIADRPDEVVTGVELAAAGASQAAFDRLVARGRVFARVEPVQKLAIVEALQRAGEIVAVTGDGVNDAPALTAGDIGVAMGRDGTDVTRDAADLILADDNFASIVAGVEEGRIAYDNVRKLIFLLIATGLAEIVLFFLTIMSGLPIPLSAVQLLWLNLVTNGIQHVALAFERGEPGVLARPPRPADQGLFDRSMVTQVLVAGVFMGAMAFVFFDWCLARGMSAPAASNLVLLLMVLFENVHALNARSETRSAFAVPFAANPGLICAVVGTQALHIAALYLPHLSDVLDVAPVALLDWLMVAAVAASLMVVMEGYKRLFAGRNGGAGGGPGGMRP